MRSVGLATGISDLERVVIKTVDGTPVFLRDLAEVRIGGAIRRGVQTRDGVGEVVAGQVIKLFGANSSTVIGAVEEKLDEVNQILPDGVQDRALLRAEEPGGGRGANRDLGAPDRHRPGGPGAAGLHGWCPRQPRRGALSIPFSVLAAFIGMRLFGISANLMSFGGLAIAIGMMVDGTIVMVENIDRLLREASPEDSRLEIVARASAEVARPILFAISIIVIVFLPLFTLQGVEGKTFRPLAYTVVDGHVRLADLRAPGVAR